MPAMLAHRSLALSVILAVSACGSDKDPTPSSPKTTSPTPKTSSVATTSAKPRPSAPVAAPAPQQSAIRENASVGPAQGDASLELRLFVSKLTTKDSVRLAFRWRPSTPIGRDHPWFQETIGWSEALDGLRFEIKQEGGATQTFEIGTNRKVASGSNLSDLVRDVTITSAGLIDGSGEPLPWKTPKDLFAKPGKYTVSLSGTMKTSKRTLPVVSKPLSFEVVDASDAQKSIADLEAAASELLTNELSLKGKPRSTAPIVDDVDGNRWFRFELEDRNGGYDVDVVELLLEPSGKKVALDRYSHFTCVAEKTLITTPSGDVPVESLVVGQEVVSYDETRGERAVSRVLQIESAHAESLVSLTWGASGALRVTASHPVFVDGTWTLAGDIADGSTLITNGFGVATVTAAPIELPTQVYDLSVSAPNTYFAGGVLLHNKAVHVPIGGHQPFRGWFFRRAAKI